MSYLASASASASHVIFLITFLASVFALRSATVVEDLANLHPPSDFNTTIISNCLKDPSLRYCNSSPVDLNEIFRFTIVASHLCNESKNPNCVASFPIIDLRNRPKITPLYLSFSFFWKYCPISIHSIDLSNNSLKGSFPTDVLLCTQIQALDLSHNELSGDVPIQSFSPLINLTLLNLSYNQFSESKISDSEFFKRFNSSSFLNSGLLPSHQKYRIKAVILLLGFPILVILMVGCLWWLCFRRPDLLPRMLRNKHKFSNSMLMAATDRFSKKNMVGKRDGFAIYRGILRDGTEVRIEMYSNNISRETRRRFVEDCKILVQLRHKNLVQVYGWCSNRNSRALVTEWTGEESVEMWLSESAPPWKHRLKVLVGVVKGMCYLQEQWPEVGYDLRTSTVLLHENAEPLIARFKVGESSITKKVYRFGVFLLEMMTNGRLMREEFEGSEAGFIEYLKMHYPGNLHKAIDERMRLTENTFDQAKQAIGIGLMCTDHSTSRQPSLGQIYSMITRVYASCLVLASKNHKNSHADGRRGPKHI